MTVLRRLGQAVGAAVPAIVGILLILESTDIIGGRWRHDLASATHDVVYPSWGLWLSALTGVALAAFGLALVAAQLLPAGKGLNRAHEVSSGDDGRTRIRGRAAVSAAEHELTAIHGVIDVDAAVGHQRLDVDVEVDDTVNLEEVENEARRRLGHDFWLDLGLDDFTVNLLIMHRHNPSRVR